jgi:hypothetical protein
MGSNRRPQSVKLVIGLIFKDESILLKAESILKNAFGKTDFESVILPFIHTDYYELEFGRDLLRKFIGFKKLVTPKSLPKIKILTNNIEDKLSRGSKRLINIDPGYLDLAKLVLASTKDFAHRIYLDKGIYAEITLAYQHKTFNAREWTYPDYRTPEYIAIFNQLREIYMGQIKSR